MVEQSAFECPYGVTAESIPSPPPRPGDELRKLLSGLGIKASGKCRCHAVAAQMNAWGPDECERRIEEIVDAMDAEAKTRGWLRVVPFRKLGARRLVRVAIRNSRRAAGI